MSGSISYRIEKDYISREKMRFAVFNRRPVYTTGDEKAVSVVIEQQLFAVFCKYV